MDVDWLIPSLIGLTGAVVGSLIAFVSGWMVTSRRLRSEIRMERRRTYASFLSQTLSLVDLASSSAMVSKSLESALAQEPSGRIEVLRSRVDRLADQEGNALFRLRSKLFEVQLIAPEHLSKLADDLVAVTMKFSIDVHELGSVVEVSAGEDVRRAIAAFTALAKWDADYPDSWVIPKLASWIAGKRRNDLRLNLS